MSFRERSNEINTAGVWAGDSGASRTAPTTTTNGAVLQDEDSEGRSEERMELGVIHVEETIKTMT